MSSKELETARDEHEHWVLMMREKLRGSAPQALERMEALSTMAESEAVRFQATKDLLDRAGIKAPATAQVVEVDVAIRQAELQAVDHETSRLLTRLHRNQEALPGPQLELDALIVLEGDDEELVTGDPVEGAIEASSHEA